MARIFILLVTAVAASAQNPGAENAGREFYLGHCSHCHGPEGEGGRGVNLTTGRYRLSTTDDDLLRVIRAGIPGTEMPPSRLPAADIQLIVAYVRKLGAAGASEKAQGHAGAGLEVYQKSGCPQCHLVGDHGGDLGPPLDSIGLRRSLAFLRESLLQPNAYVPKEWRGAVVVTRGGEHVRGLRLNEDDYSIQIRDIGGRIRSYRKSEVEAARRLDSSLMPEYGTLPAADLENLIAYLNSLRGKL
jgi:cytochrome c oxidase cbb3-type subunit 3